MTSTSNFSGSVPEKTVRPYPFIPGLTSESGSVSGAVRQRVRHAGADEPTLATAPARCSAGRRGVDRRGRW